MNKWEALKNQKKTIEDILQPSRQTTLPPPRESGWEGVLGFFIYGILINRLSKSLTGYTIQANGLIPHVTYMCQQMLKIAETTGL